MDDRYYDLCVQTQTVEVFFPYQILSIIELGIDIFLPTILTISLHTTSLTPSIAFIFSRRSRIEPLSLTIASTLKSIVCSPLLLATYVTSSEVSNLLATGFTIPFLMDIKKSTRFQPNFSISNI